MDTLIKEKPITKKKKETLSVSRKEIKYLVSIKDRLYLLNCLEKILTPDSFGGYNGYSVRSLYFDSISNGDYIDKMSKSDVKKRVRLRIYTTKDVEVKFELKRKEFGRQLKESIKISKDDAIEMMSGNYKVLLDYNSDISEYAYNLMSGNRYRPVSLIEYDRRAYTHRSFNTRITLDNNLRYSDFNYDLFGDNINFKQALDKDKTILEVKYDRFLFEQIQDVLINCNLQEKPPSKYASSRQLLQEYNY